jgi:hypothetical protein
MSATNGESRRVMINVMKLTTMPKPSQVNTAVTPFV